VVRHAGHANSYVRSIMSRCVNPPRDHRHYQRQQTGRVVVEPADGIDARGLRAAARSPCAVAADRCVW
jgi:hypothetical protein